MDMERFTAMNDLHAEINQLKVVLDEIDGKFHFTKIPLCTVALIRPELKAVVEEKITQLEKEFNEL